MKKYRKQFLIISCGGKTGGRPGRGGGTCTIKYYDQRPEKQSQPAVIYHLKYKEINTYL